MNYFTFPIDKVLKFSIITSMVKNAVSASANAKINLHLEVLGKRKDGFHEIVSIFHPISLADELLIQKDTGSGKCVVYSPLFELPVKNTITKAYEEFKKASGIDDGITVKLIKNIPVGAGLGGGSSDAASVLLGLNRIFNTKFSAGELKELALKIGSDVPFFIENRPAIVKGRGEHIEPIQLDLNYFGVLVYPEIQSSTAEAYSLLNRKADELCSASFKPGEFCSENCCKWPFFNSFEGVLFKKHPAIKEVKDRFLKYGADFALMSGAGSSVFGLFSNEKLAKTAYFELFNQYKLTFLFFLLAF